MVKPSLHCISEGLAYCVALQTEKPVKPKVAIPKRDYAAYRSRFNIQSEIGR